MLPGFRFLFAAIMLSMSLMIFGLGAASLLRSAHEEFASNPSWRAAPEVKFAQPSEATMPVLATLRLDVRQEPPPQEEASAVPAAPEVTASPQPAAEQVAATRAEPSSPPEIAKPETVAPTSTGVEVLVGSSAASEFAAVSPQNASPQKTAAAEGAKDEPRQESAQESGWQSGQDSRQELAQPSSTATIAASDPSPRGDLPLAVAPEPDAAETAAPAESPADLAWTRIATLGGPPVDIVSPAKVKAGETKPDENATKKREEARRAAQRRRIAAARARLAAQQAQQLGPFFQPSALAARAQ
jgi:hypothetical protein